MFCQFRKPSASVRSNAISRLAGGPYPYSIFLPVLKRKISVRSPLGNGALCPGQKMVIVNLWQEHEVKYHRNRRIIGHIILHGYRSLLPKQGGSGPLLRKNSSRDP